jgi:hypothetical protein
VTFSSGETAAAVLAGFTITTNSGRGISCTGASPTIRNCRVKGNSASGGGGFYLSNSSATILNCLIYSNFTGMSGAGGIFSQGGSPTILNCTIASNSCGAGGAFAGGVGVSSGSATLRNCILWGNTYNGTAEQGHVNGSATVSYSCVQSGTGGIVGNVTWGSGILSADPLFADSANGDYHLKSTAGRWNGSAWVNDAQSSPCLDAGCPTDDYSLEPVGNGGRVNLGTFANTPEASRSSAPGPVFVTSVGTLSVPEGGTAQFTLCLSLAPGADLTAALALDTGADADLSITSSTSLVFTPANWATPQTIALAAAEDDADAANGAATLRIAATGVPDKTVALTEADDEVTLTVAADAGGTASPAGTTVRAPGEVVPIAATPATDVQFDAWTGDTATVANPAAAQTTVTVNTGTALLATFILPFVTYYVDGTAGNNAHGGFAQAWDGTHGPKQTVQAAIDAAYSDTANSGEVVIVLPGTYAEIVTFRGLDITLTGVDPDDLAVVAGTIISAPSGTTAVTFGNGETAASVLTGLTLTSTSGRGISCTGASPTIRNCRIVGNSSAAGGGIYLSGSSAAIRNCLVYGNFTGMSGAGGIYTQSGSPTLENCTIAGNSAGMGGALAGGVGVSSGSATLRNCILWGNTYGGNAAQGTVNGSATVSYSCIQGGTGGVSGNVTWGSGILSADPLFADSGNGNYRLQSAGGRWTGTAWVNDGQTSPCIDAGDPADSYAEESAPNGARVNLGSDGNTPQASRSLSGGPEFVLTPSALTVPEGGSNSFSVTLSQAPAADVAVTVSVASGDADIGVSAGASFTLNATNWSTGQSVALAAAEDSTEIQNGQAVIAVQATGLTTAQLTATEADDDASLTVTGATPAGTTIHELGSVVTVTPAPPEHYQFAWWTGDVPVGQQTQNPLQLSLIANATVTAQFALVQHTVSATCDHGTVTGAGTYDYGTQIDLGVTAAAGYHFDQWTGDVPTGHEADNPLALTVTGDLTLTAVCVANQPALVVSTASLAVPEGASAGFTVTLNLCPPGTVAVSAAMQAQGDADLTILSGSALAFTPADWNVPQTVAATAAEDDDVLQGTRTVTVSAAGMADATVLCQESDDDVTLTVAGGTPAGTTIHESGSVVEIAATPDVHHHFTEWTGDTGALANALAQTTQATLSANTTLAAQQAIDRHTLTLTSAHGNPQGAGEYDYGTTVDWSVASPVYGAVGVRYVAGQTAGQVLLDQDRTVEIAWTTQYLLSVSAGDHGSAGPAAQWYDAGSTASAGATADLGWHFTGWTGDVPQANETDNPVSLAMDQPRSLAVAFDRNPTTYWAAVKTGSDWSANWPARADSAWRELASLAASGGWQSDFSAHVTAGQSGFGLDALAIAARGGTAIAADGFEAGTTGQPPPGWAFNATWGDLGVVVVTEAMATAGTKSLALAGSTTDQGLFLPASAAAGDTRVSLALYLPATLPSSTTLVSLWYDGICVSLRTSAAGAPELGLGQDAAAPAVFLGQPLAAGAWNGLTLFVQTVTDTDADGMDDAWETAAFGGLSRDGSGDYDADGFSDLLEWQCGTDPAAASPSVALVAPAQTDVTEAASTVTCQLQLSQAATAPVIANLSFAGSATPGTDYTISSATEVLFAPGQTSVDIPLTIIPDAVWDPAETIVLTLTAASGACLGSPSQVTLTIREADDDGDGMDDQWEVLHFGSTAATPSADPDEDGLTNLAEFAHQSDPTDADTNGDGLGDGAAVAWGLAPAQPTALVAITSPANGKVLP